jgi:hypothetical protein
MNDILDALWDADGMADTCIMLSTLIPTTNVNGAVNRDTINDQYRALVTERAADGNCIYLADMDPGGTPWLIIPDDYMANEEPHVHPNDAGHKKMAAIFYQAINEAIDDNVLVAPGNFTTGETVCDKYAGSGTDAGGLTQRGSGYGDGIYYHDSTEEGARPTPGEPDDLRSLFANTSRQILWTAVSDWDRGQWKFARLFDQDYDDLVAWINETDSSQVYAVW